MIEDSHLLGCNFDPPGRWIVLAQLTAQRRASMDASDLSRGDISAVCRTLHYRVQTLELAVELSTRPI